jgi:site-specific recombinase XerD
MFDVIYRYQGTIDRHRAAPLAEQRVSYLAHCKEQGAAMGTLQLTAQMMLVIIKELDLKVGGKVSRRKIVASADRWATRQPRPYNMRHARKARSHFISVATQWLRFLGRLHLRKTQQHHYTPMVQEFADYMIRERGLSRHTLDIQCWIINDFLSRSCDRNHPLNELSVARIDEAIALKGSRDGYTRRSIRHYAESLRSFLRYAERLEWCPGLAIAVKAPRLYTDETLPAGPSWADVQRLLAETKGDRLTDIRDHAILMLLAVYGLRSAELRGLRIEDLDWDKELIHITRPKQRKAQLYPLVPTVGEPVLRYLKEVRPHSPYREVFLTSQAPIQPLSRPGLWHIVGRRLRTLSASLNHHGPHSLWHACATHLLAQGLSLKEVGDHLGHRSPSATRTYAKVDIVGLRQVAEFELGGLL